MKVCQECKKIIGKSESYYDDGDGCYLCEVCHEAIMAKNRQALRELEDAEYNEIYDQIGEHLYEHDEE